MPLYRASYPGVPQSVSAIRLDLRQVLGAAGIDQDVIDTAVLLASELASNAVQHACQDDAESSIAASARVRDGMLRVDVMDVDVSYASLVKAMPRPPSADREDGRGLFLVESLSRRWGYDRLNSYKSVWFELPTTA